MPSEASTESVEEPEFALQLTHEDFHLGWCSRMAST